VQQESVIDVDPKGEGFVRLQLFEISLLELGRVEKKHPKLGTPSNASPFKQIAVAKLKSHKIIIL